MTDVILTDAEIDAIYAIDYVSDRPVEFGMGFKLVQNIIAFPSFDDDWDPTDPATSALAA